MIPTVRCFGVRISKEGNHLRGGVIKRRLLEIKFENTSSCASSSVGLNFIMYTEITSANNIILRPGARRNRLYMVLLGLQRLRF